jgi:hypothetical protein
MEAGFLNRLQWKASVNRVLTEAVTMPATVNLLTEAATLSCCLY